MRSFFTYLFFFCCLSVASAQTTKQKPATTAKKQATITSSKATTATAAKKPVATTQSSATVAVAPTQPVASTLTFPSTEPENATTMDAVKKQQMYDELHGVKPQSTAPDMGRKGRGPQNGQRSPSGVATRPNTKASVSEAGTYIGVRAGGNYNAYLQQLTVPNGVGGTIDVTPDPIYGFHAGVVFQFGRGAVAFQPEINFHQDYLKTSLRTVTANSLIVPLFAKFQFGQQDNTRFFINLGPYGGYSLDPDNSDSVIAYGGALGLGVGIPAGSGKFTIEARGYYPLGDSRGTYDFGNIPGTPITGQFSLGYLFPIGGR